MNISDVMPFCFSVFFISFIMYLLRNEKTVKKNKRINKVCFVRIEKSVQ